MQSVQLNRRFHWRSQISQYVNGFCQRAKTAVDQAISVSPMVTVMTVVPSLAQAAYCPFPVSRSFYKGTLVTSALSARGRTEFIKLFQDCSRNSVVEVIEDTRHHDSSGRR